MKQSIKIRLLPTEEQEVLMLKSSGCSRFAYNWALNKCNEKYNNNEKYSIANIRKEFTKLKKEEKFKWLNEVSSKVTQESIRNLDKAFKSFFNKQSKYPKFKTKRKSKQSFYVRCDSLYFTDDMCNIEKIGKVRFKTNYSIPKNCKYSNPYCSYNGRCWVLSFSVEVEENQTALNEDLSIGIDLGVKDLATCSNGDVFNNIRNNYIHQTTNKIIKHYPYRIVIEDLNVSGMMKNKHLSKAIAEQGFYEFMRQIKYKCEFNGIEFIQVDRFYPSSKTCSCCGSIKKDLKLNDRNYKCD